jgi:hypothetical protein
LKLRQQNDNTVGPRSLKHHFGWKLRQQPYDLPPAVSRRQVQYGRFCLTAVEVADKLSQLHGVRIWRADKSKLSSGEVEVYIVHLKASKLALSESLAGWELVILGGCSTTPRVLSVSGSVTISEGPQTAVVGKYGSTSGGTK